MRGEHALLLLIVLLCCFAPVDCDAASDRAFLLQYQPRPVTPVKIMTP
jgi:hypothetical protein